MLDAKRVGIKIAALRKSAGYSQEKLADLLFVTPQAISKWENGRALPETSLLPVLAQVFSCTIDAIILPAYAFDEAIEEQKTDAMSLQAEQIANRIMKSLEGKIATKKPSAFSDDTVVQAIRAAHGDGQIGGFSLTRGAPAKVNGNTESKLIMATLGREYRLLERVYGKNDAEFYRYAFLRQHAAALPHVYAMDFDGRAILLEDLSESYIAGYDFNEDNANGEIIRANYPAILKAAAKWHAGFWENGEAFEQIGPEWRLESKENVLAHISCMARDYRKYRKNETSGKIPKTWEADGHLFENHITARQLDRFEEALNRLKKEYPPLIASRFQAGKNITVIHGDLHPGATMMEKAEDRSVKFIGLQAVRMGLCTEDLAMLLALHIEPEREKALPLLEEYYNFLCEMVKDYPWALFLKDYKIAVMENMFFTIRLLNRGIFDFGMRDRALRAFESFVLEA